MLHKLLSITLFYFFFSCCYGQQEKKNLVFSSGDSLQVFTIGRKDNYVQEVLIKNRKRVLYSDFINKYVHISPDIKCIYEYQSKTYQFVVLDTPYLLIGLEINKTAPNNTFQSYNTYTQFYFLKYDLQKKIYKIKRKFAKKCMLFYDKKSKKFHFLEFQPHEQTDKCTILYLSYLNVQNGKLSSKKRIVLENKILVTKKSILIPLETRVDFCEETSTLPYLIDYLYEEHLIK